MVDYNMLGADPEFSVIHLAVLARSVVSLLSPIPMETSPSSPGDLTSMDTIFWRETLGRDLRILLDGAEYDRTTQQAALTTVSRYVAPCLGPRPLVGEAGRDQLRPVRWRSFMTDDFSPIEYSWSWENLAPTIRYSFEPIGRLAGTSQDPYNRTAPLGCVQQLRGILPAADWRWFDHFAQAFRGPTTLPRKESPSHSSPSTTFLAFNLEKHGHRCKSYHVPHSTSDQLGGSRLDVLHQACRALQQQHGLPAYDCIEQFLRQQEQSSTPPIIIGVAVDCVHPSVANLKVYFRSCATSFDSVQGTLSMAGASPSWDTRALEELRELWHLTLGLPFDFPNHQQLPSKDHETSGVLYNFGFKQGQRYPDTKVYIPVRHYARSDRAIVQGLVEYLARCGRAEQAERFVQTLERLVESFRSLDEACGLQTYIACGNKDGRLSLTSYLSAEIYYPGRWSRQP
ncbi:putative dimethylallyl tryptophan synthase [Aspergillus fijiensis CBS 313.89]|uniref:Putative dimethylallyl tryptophan synthase n=1 Tax=Aspergillus fijiensis CBS 313.89 TaxID=1448319 RepID=A0A8G1VWH7_9EURO|nr:putative dimethylallyl tryptophan synthase [Aspergillus fijiensis CBS 313.89]RAK75585.1 putative dimethylallyl tryptophan synthase [Aspergillus fijiensis CBS 313.89]